MFLSFNPFFPQSIHGVCMQRTGEKNDFSIAQHFILLPSIDIRRRIEADEGIINEITNGWRCTLCADDAPFSDLSVCREDYELLTEMLSIVHRDLLGHVSCLVGLVVRVQLVGFINYNFKLIDWNAKTTLLK